MALIPAYNEELTIGSIVAKTKKYIETVFVIDDGSVDSTAAIAESYGATVIRSNKNQGKALALKKGFEIAKNLDLSVVMLDADGQHNPDDIPKLMDPIIEDKADLVIGSRFIDNDNHNIPGYRQVGQKLLNRATNISAKSNVSDSQSGFRAINRKALDIMMFDSNGYNVESDMICHFSTNGLRIMEVPIYARYDTPNNHKKSPISHGIGVMYNVISKIGYHRPLLFFGVSSIICGLIGAYFGLRALYYFWDTRGIMFGSSLAATLFIILSVNLFSLGLILNYLLKYKKDEKI